MLNFNFYNPTHLIFGSGTLSELGKQKLPGKKALLLISNGKSTRRNGSFDRVTSQLREAGVEVAVFDKLMENPIKDVVMSDYGHTPDESMTLAVNARETMGGLFRPCGNIRRSQRR